MLSCVLSKNPCRARCSVAVAAVLTLPHSMTAGILNILSLIAITCCLFACTISRDLASGIWGRIVAALISPFGLSALSELLVLKLGDLTYALWAI